MGILTWLLLGALAGWISSLIMGTDAEQGALGNIFVGIIGALIGGFVMGIFNKSGVTGFNVYSVFVAVLGACIALGIYRAFKGRSAV